eukprot:1136707-Pelagomonas_calceolata.AAC.5
MHTFSMLNPWSLLSGSGLQQPLLTMTQTSSNSITNSGPQQSPRASPCIAASSRTKGCAAATTQQPESEMQRSAACMRPLLFYPQTAMALP